MDQLISFLTYAVFGVPLWTVIGIVVAALFFPQVRQIVFTRFKAWAMGKLSKGSEAKAIALLIMPMLAIGLMAGCASQQTHPQQIADQGGSAIDVSKATYLQANEYLSTINERFAEQVEAFPATAKDDPDVRAWVQKVNEMLDEAGAVLDDWKLANVALNLTDAVVSEAEWREIRNKLIQAGIALVIDTK